MVPPEHLPGYELVEKGLDDLQQSRVTEEALLVSIGAPRLRSLGLPIPRVEPDPEHRLYLMLHRRGTDAAHSRYNALIRRLVSFERAFACVS